MKALIIVDVQNDFARGGALEVPDADAIMPVINDLQQRFDLVVATQDWHPMHHQSFASAHPGKRPFETIMLEGLEQVLWPDHCVQGTSGAQFHAGLNMNRIEAIFRKGMEINIDSYSGLYDNGHRKSTGLAGYLRERKVNEVYVCGLAADYCVFFTAKDLLKEGFSTVFIEDATRAISPEGFEEARKTIKRMNGRLILSSHV
jgi:nicotinamidase/pyrazinamidase